MRNEWVSFSQGFFLLLIHTSYLVGMAVGMYTYPIPTFYTFVAPWIVATFAMSLGNFGQHIFVDPEKHDCNYRLTYNIMSEKI